MIQAQQEPEPDWEALSRKWEKSNQNQMDFCREQGLSYSQFKNARARLGHCRPKRKSKGKALVPRPAKRKATVATKPKPTALRSSNLSFLPLAVEMEPVSRGRNQTAKGAKLEVELPFGVVLRFLGVDSDR